VIGRNHGELGRYSQRTTQFAVAASNHNALGIFDGDFLGLKLCLNILQ